MKADARGRLDASGQRCASFWISTTSHSASATSSLWRRSLCRRIWRCCEGWQQACARVAAENLEQHSHPGYRLRSSVPAACSFDDDDQAPAPSSPTQETVGEALADAAVDVIGDEVSAPAQPVRTGQHITIAVRCRSSCGRCRTLSTRTQQARWRTRWPNRHRLVGAGPGDTAPMHRFPAMIASRSRVREDVLYEDERIPFSTVWRPDDDLSIDQHVVANAGQEGFYGSASTSATRMAKRSSAMEAGFDAAGAAEPRHCLWSQDQAADFGNAGRPHHLLAAHPRLHHVVQPAAVRHAQISAVVRAHTLGLTWQRASWRSIPPSSICARRCMCRATAGSCRRHRRGVQGKWVDLGYDDASYQSWHWWTECICCGRLRQPFHSLRPARLAALPGQKVGVGRRTIRPPDSLLADLRALGMFRAKAWASTICRIRASWPGSSRRPSCRRMPS